jgi:nucleoside-diphosphate-sugar epimerase
MQEFIGK